MSEDDDDSSKTEDASERKLGKAREEGDVAVSQDVKTWFSLVGVAVLMSLMIPGLMADLKSLLTGLLARPHDLIFDEPHIRKLFVDVAVDVALLLALPLGMMMGLGVAASLVQTGLMYTPKKIAPELKKISPLAGLKRLFSGRTVVEFVKNIAKLTLVGTVAFLVSLPEMEHLEALTTMPLPAILDFLHVVIIKIMIAVLMVMAAVTAFDFFYQRFAFAKKMRMTKQEVKDEHKQSEGDPMIKGRLRALRHERARKRMMAAVPGADVVITNPTHYAIALTYDQDSMNAPVLVAKGVDLVALRIRELADEHDIPIVENPPLARALYATVELDQEVPQEHYKAVAEVIGYVMRVKGYFGKKR